MPALHRTRLLTLSGSLLLAAGPALAQGHSSTLHTTPQFSALPQTRTNPTKAQAPTAIHTGDWGVFNQLDGSPAGFGPVARYGVSRWAEDWRALRDPRNRVDPFDPVKYIPLTASGDIYLTLSGESRLKNWFETRPFLGTQKPDDSGRMTVRNLIGADLHLGQHLRVFGELVNAAAAGWGGYGYGATYRTRLDVQQLFVEAKARLAGAKTGVMLGRQEFLDAPNYVLYLRETPNMPLSYNGVRGYAVWPRIRFDAWNLVQTNVNPTAMFADDTNWNARLFGGLMSYAVPDFKVRQQPGRVFVDLFYIGYLLGNGSASVATATGTVTGSSRRDNLGIRIWGRAGPVEFSVGGIHQGGYFRATGSRRSRDVDAYAINSFVGYRFARTRFRPLLGLQADLFSGGDSRNGDGSVGTYITPFNPSSNYLDTTTYFGPSNLINIAPLVEITPTTTTLLRLRAPILWRASTNDAVYASNKIYGYRDNFSGGFVGSVPQINFAWRVTTHLTWNHDLARALVSRSLQKAGASDGSYYLSTLAFRF